MLLFLALYLHSLVQGHDPKKLHMPKPRNKVCKEHIGVTILSIWRRSMRQKSVQFQADVRALSSTDFSSFSKTNIMV